MLVSMYLGTSCQETSVDNGIVTLGLCYPLKVILFVTRPGAEQQRQPEHEAEVHSPPLPAIHTKRRKHGRKGKGMTPARRQLEFFCANWHKERVVRAWVLSATTLRIVFETSYSIHTILEKPY